MGTLIYYLDKVEEAGKKNSRHRVLLSYKYRFHKDFQQNRRPGNFEQALDFSDNWSLKNARQVKSECFNSIQYSVIFSVWSWIDASMWDLVEVDIKRGAEVPMDGEPSFELTNPKLFWVTVVSDSYVNNGFYTVEDIEGVLHQCCRECLCLRVKFSIIVGGVSNYKTHYCHRKKNFTEI